MPTLTMSSTLLTFRCRADSGNLRYASLPQHSSRVGRINSACYTYTCYTYTDDHVGIRAQYRGIDLVMQVSVKSAINHRNRERERINCLGGRGEGQLNGACEVLVDSSARAREKIIVEMIALHVSL